METHSVSNIHGNFKELRNMWSSKAQPEPQQLRSLSYPLCPQPQQKKSSKEKIPILKITTETPSIPTIKEDLPNNERTTIFGSVEKLPTIEEHSSFPIPPPPPTIIFQHQAQSVGILKQTVNKMNTQQQKKNILQKNTKNNGIHRWHVTSHVFRSGLIFNRIRRSSDSILPLLIKTQKANYRPRTDSLDSTLSQTPFENLIDYVTYDKDSLTVPITIKRSISETSDCIRRNKLDDSILQYEMILRHLKNYKQFTSKYPIPTSKSLKQNEQSFDRELNTTLNETEVKFLARTSIPNRDTQSLSRNVGRTFSEFIMNDLFSSLSSSSSSKKQRCSITHASSQTDSSESTQIIQVQTNNSVTTEEAKAVLNEFDTMLNNSIQESPITPNSEINVVVLNSPTLSSPAQILPVEKPLMQRLFEGRKTAYSPDDLHMETIRLPEEMMPTYETARKKCFFDSEELIYAAKMIKVSRRGYTQHVRMLCITTERVYNLTKRDPYPKEGLLFNDILGITCTPFKDGFICIHTRETHEDRGDWLLVVDHPCEFITQLFMILERDNNDDNFLKFESKFKHCRRCYGEASYNDCTIEARLSDSFRIKKADFDLVIIYTT